MNRYYVRVVPLWICAVLLTFYALYFARTLIVPVVISGLVYLCLRPIVRRLKRYHVPDGVAAAGLMIGIVALVGAAFVAMAGPARKFSAQAPNHIDELSREVRGLQQRLQLIDEATEEIEEIAEENGSTEPAEEPIEVSVTQPSWASQWSLVNKTGNVVGLVVAVLVLTFFLLSAGDELINCTLHLLPTFSDRRNAFELLLRIQHAVGVYLGTVTLINTGLGIAIASAMWLCGMPSPLLWGVMATLLNFIPYAGALAGVAIVFLLGVVTFDSLSQAFLVAAVYLSLTSLEGQFITPSILGNRLKMNPVMVILSVAFWGWLWGIVGVFLAVPLLIVARLTLQHFEATQTLALMLAGSTEIDVDMERRKQREQTSVVEDPVLSVLQKKPTQSNNEIGAK